MAIQGTTAVSEERVIAVLYDGPYVAGNIPIFTSTGQLQDSGAAPQSTAQPVDFSGNGAASTPNVKISGTWFTGGTTTTTKPAFLVEPAGTTTTSWSTSGTGIGINAPSGFVGQLIDFKVNNTSMVVYDANTTALKAANASGYGGQIRYLGISTRSTGYIGWAGSDSADGAIDTLFTRRGAANINLGGSDAASPVAQTLSTQGSRAGTDSNVGGASLTIKAGVGTGTGTLSSLLLQSPVAVASGSGAQTSTTGLAVKGGTAVLTSYTVATLPSAATVGAGATAFVTDANATTFLSIVAGGGSNKVPVVSDGADWLIG